MDYDDQIEIQNLKKRKSSLDNIAKIVARNYKEPGLLENDLKRFDYLFRKSKKIGSAEMEEFENIKMRLQPLRETLYSGMPQTHWARIYNDLKNVSIEDAYIKERLRVLKERV